MDTTEPQSISLLHLVRSLVAFQHDSPSSGNARSMDTNALNGQVKHLTQVRFVGLAPQTQEESDTKNGRITNCHTEYGECQNHIWHNQA